MPWLRLDDGFSDHPKIIGLDDGAYRLHVDALVFCARTLTDGFVSKGALRRLPNGHLVEELVDAGLWEPSGEGWWIHDFLDYNQSAEQVLEEREKARERQRRRRSRTPETDPDPTGPPARHAVTPPVTTGGTPAVSSPSPSRPVPSSIPDSSRQSHTATRPDPDPEPTTDDDRFLAAVNAAVDLKVTDARPDRNPAAYRATVARTVPAEHGDTLRHVLAEHPEWPTNWVAQEALGRPRTDPTPREVIDACPDCTNGLVETDAGMAPCPACSWARNGNRTGAVT